MKLNNPGDSHPRIVDPLGPTATVPLLGVGGFFSLGRAAGTGSSGTCPFEA